MTIVSTNLHAACLGDDELEVGVLGLQLAMSPDHAMGDGHVARAQIFGVVVAGEPADLALSFSSAILRRPSAGLDRGSAGCRPSDSMIMPRPSCASRENSDTRPLNAGSQNSSTLVISPPVAARS